MQKKVDLITKEVKKIIQGKDNVIKMTLAAILAGGHVLLEDIPGVGKTTMAMSFARALSMDYKRMQFTPDVLPSDLVGFNMYDKNLGEFRFQPGSVYTNLFLADEINRTSPKTQSALLEVMEEGKATVEGVTRELPNPFFVIATQNPFGSSGTQRLPESQLDRFIICESIGYPDTLSATAILKGSSEKDLGSIVPIINKEELLEMQKAVNNMHVDECLYDYIVEITEGTRRYDVFDLGLSPRGSIALLKMSKAYAYIQGRDYVTPDDVKAVYLPVSLHRVKLSSKSKAAGLPLEAALMNVLAAVNIPKIDFAQK
ncbi:MAG: MoxR family ATPase [Lachnospiraceae bacterium]|nr:MoxR family ATPase [Lachnospiraceae bacterium]